MDSGKDIDVLTVLSASPLPDLAIVLPHGRQIKQSLMNRRPGGLVSVLSNKDLDELLRIPGKISAGASPSPVGPRIDTQLFGRRRMTAESVFKFFCSSLNFHSKNQARTLCPTCQEKNRSDCPVDKTDDLSYCGGVEKTDRITQLDGILGKNVAAILDRRGIGKSPFASSVGIDDAYFRKLLNGKRRWNTDLITKVSDGLRIAPEFLFNPEIPVANKPPSLNVHPTQKFKKFGGQFAKENYLPVPLLKDPVAAGLPREVTESEIDGWALIYASNEWMPNDPEEYTCARISGYSMAPILEPGDIVSIDHLQRDPLKLQNKIVAFRHNGGVTVKWLRIYEDKHLVIGEPENRFEHQSTVVFDYDEAYDHIVGRIAWWWAKR